MWKYLDGEGVGRDKLDAFEATQKDIEYVLSQYDGKYVINCMGVIKQKRPAPEVIFKVNTVFPHLLASACAKLKKRLIHISTDCVFSGEESWYAEDIRPNAKDMYGVSKYYGEPSEFDAIVLRTSIIGEELKGKLSLLEWVRSNNKKTIRGYDNHFWNGVTCLELSKAVKEFVDEKSFYGLYHIISPDAVSKYELIGLIADIFEIDVKVIKTHPADSCDRTLNTYHIGRTRRKTSIKDQLIELKEFGPTLRGE
jgi:dTDP-4-dehydrorhamnose reductase